jgi:hypothetical protein
MLKNEFTVLVASNWTAAEPQHSTQANADSRVRAHGGAANPPMSECFGTTFGVLLRLVLHPAGPPMMLTSNALGSADEPKPRVIFLLPDS